MSTENEKTAPTVSVVIPCYNHGEFLSDAISSVRRQTYTDYEIIIVDDGSDEPETVRVLDENPFIGTKIIRTENKGPSSARNTAIENALGRYILPLDADDLIESTYLEKAVKVLDCREDVGIVYCKGTYFGAKTDSWDLPDYSLQSMLQGNAIFVTALFRRCDWEAVGGFKSDLTMGYEDYDFWLSIIGSGREVYQIPEALFRYRKHFCKESRHDEFSFQRRSKALQMIYKRHISLYRDNVEALFGIIDSYCDEILRLQEKCSRRPHIQLQRLLKKVKVRLRKIANPGEPRH